MGESALARYGLNTDAPIASFIKRLTCHQCGHHGVKAFRATMDEAQVFMTTKKAPHAQQQKRPA
jgi:hypothetical protein